MEEKKVNAEASQAHRRPVRRPKKKAPVFKYVYFSVLAVLLIISACMLGYVHRSLKAYEACQPENVLNAQIEELRAGDRSVLSFDKLRQEYGVSEAEIDKFHEDFLAGSITFSEDYAASTPERKAYHVLCNGVIMAKAALNHQGQETRMLVFTMDNWATEPMEVIGYTFQKTYPASVIIKNNGQVLEGKTENGQTVYDVRSLSPMNLEICDILGNSVPYDAASQPSYTEYRFVIPSNYTIQGVESISKEQATVEDDPSMAALKEYWPDAPGKATYTLWLLSGELNVKILDQNGREIPYTPEGQSIVLSEPVGQDTLPAGVDIDPMKVAKLWSLFMTADLSGSNYGYGQLSPYLLKGSTLQDSAWKWATGIDITFTSAHKLKDPQFQVEEISNYISYSENCFSCDIRLEKTLVLTRTGEEVLDKINARFYFMNYDDSDNGVDDPHWVLVAHQGIH